MKVLDKMPIWALTIILMVVGALASVFTGSVYTDLMMAYGLTSAITPILAIVIIGAAYGGIMRLVLRIVYGVGDRIFFGTMRAVPDYNLRRLPVPYNSFVRVSLVWLIVAKCFDAILSGLLMYVVPVAYYVLHFASSFITLACIFAAYMTMDKHYVPTWQSGKCFLSLAIPAVILYGLGIIL